MYFELTKYLQSKVDPIDIETICSFFYIKKTKRNEIILDFNSVCKNYYFINKGAIRLFTTNKDGSENSRFFAFEGNFATALPSFIDQKPALECLQTIEKSELLVISRSDFYHLVETIPTFALLYREILENGFIIAQKRIYGFQGFDAKEKVIWLIQNQPQVLLRISNKMAASYIGISPYTLSRTKSKI